MNYTELKWSFPTVGFDERTYMNTITHSTDFIICFSHVILKFSKLSTDIKIYNYRNTYCKPTFICDNFISRFNGDKLVCKNYFHHHALSTRFDITPMPQRLVLRRELFATKKLLKISRIFLTWEKKLVYMQY